MLKCETYFSDYRLTARELTSDTSVYISPRFKSLKFWSFSREFAS